MQPHDTGLSILVVDDEPILRTLLVRGLESKGYVVAEAADGEVAVELCRRGSYDLVLLDVSMPVMDGFTACAQLHQLYPHMPIIMLTGHDDMDSVNTAFEAGATDFITKPINLPLLGQRVRYALRSTAANRELSRAYHDQNTACRLAKLAFWQVDIRSGRLHWSKEAHQLVGLERIPEKIEDLFPILTEEQIHKLTTLFKAVINSDGTLDTELMVGKGGDVRYIRLMADNALDRNIISGAFQDISDQRTKEQQIAYLTEHDRLTGLPKRRLFLSQLQHTIDERPGDVKWVVAVLDISRLQRINDALGADAGDQLLIMVAQRLKSLLVQPALLGRLEADCFMLALPMNTSEEHCEEWLRQSLLPLKEPWQLQNQSLSLNYKIGYAIHNAAMQADQLLQAAVRAKTLVIPSRRLSFLAHDAVPAENQRATLELESQVRNALENEQFFLLYQPQQRLRDGQIVSVEALARWEHPQQRLVSPDRFIPLLENIGLMPAFTIWTMRLACRQALAWHEEGMPLTIAVNISASQFASRELVETLVAICAEEKCPAELIEIEITESMAMINPALAVEHLNGLKKNGFKIAIDDFGVGYSSLEYLLRFPHDVLKIDRTFINDITNCSGNRAIVRSIVTFCNTMHITCIAEGVETVRQRDYLDALGVDMIQGYLLAKALPAEDVKTLIQQQQGQAQLLGKEFE